MNRELVVHFTRGDRTFICDGWWCNRCKLRYSCYTNKEALSVSYSSLGGITYIDYYAIDKTATSLQLWLFGMESNSIYWKVD